MKLIFYKIKLAVNLLIFILRLSANFSNKTKPIVVSFFIVGLLLLIGGISLITNKKRTPNLIITSSAQPKNSHLYVVANKSNREIQTEIFFWENVLKSQAQSRDVLLNLSQLYSAQQDHEKALNYRNKAINIDPNNPLFK
jgi:tetratricopeptide (TPR) repeat protein